MLLHPGRAMSLLELVAVGRAWEFAPECTLFAGRLRLLTARVAFLDGTTYRIERGNRVYRLEQRRRRTWIGHQWEGYVGRELVTDAELIIRVMQVSQRH